MNTSFVETNRVALTPAQITSTEAPLEKMHSFVKDIQAFSSFSGRLKKESIVTTTVTVEMSEYSEGVLRRVCVSSRKEERND